MTDIDTLFARPDFKRGRYGWAEIAQPGGGGTKLYRRVTTVAGALDSKDALIDWTAAMVARGVAQNKGLQSSFALLDWKNDKMKVKELVGRAKDYGGGSTAADVGTAFHRVVEMHFNDEEVDSDVLPEGFGAALNAFVEGVDDLGFEVVGSEVTVVHDGLELAGTADLVLKATKNITTPFGKIAEGTCIIGDAKTGSVSELSGLAMSMQLGTYAAGEPYNASTDKRGAWPMDMNSEIGVIFKVDLDAGRVIPWWLDLTVGQAAMNLALKVEATRKKGRSAIVEHGQTATPAKAKAPKKPTATEIRNAMGKAETLAELEEVEAQYGEHMNESQRSAMAKRKAKFEPTEGVEEAEEVEEAPTKEAAPKAITPFSAEDAQAKLAEVSNLGQARDLYKDFVRGQAAADVLKLITDRAAELS